MAHTRERVLCSHCLESFPATGADGDALCPSCAARIDARGTPRSEVTGPALDRSPLPEAHPGDRSASSPPEEGIEGFGPAALVARFRRELTEARAWCEGRMPWFRILLWIYLAVTFTRHLGSSEPYRSLFDGINLGIHEAGHALFRPFGTWLMVAGGTIAQLAAPLITLFIFRRQRDYFGISVAFCWLATNFWGISVYMADARALQLPLVAPGMGMMPGGDASGGSGIIHDWNWLLGGPGLLRFDTILAGAVATAAVVTMLGGLTLGAWLIVRMLRSKEGMRLHFDDFD